MPASSRLRGVALVNCRAVSAEESRRRTARTMSGGLLDGSVRGRGGAPGGRAVWLSDPRSGSRRPGSPRSHVGTPR